MEGNLLTNFKGRNLSDLSDNRKVLIIAYAFPPIAYAGTYRTLRFCTYLPEYGWAPPVLPIKEAEDLSNV